MPLHEYECEACGHRFEAIQKFSDAPLEVCPQCSGKVRKLVSAPAIQFKGSGWYITDYARKESGSKGESAAKDGSGSDAKAEKPDTGEKADKATSTDSSAPPSSTTSSPPKTSSET
jgi:putative FmdB family regulatory protein